MKLLGISGALRKASTNTGLLRALQRVAPTGVEIEIATLHGIPLYDADAEEAYGKPPVVSELDLKIKNADGIIIATPEYNFSIPGVLKNATDWVSRRSTPFKWKRTGIVGSSQGAFAGTSRAQYHLRQNLQALQAIVMPKPEVFITHNELKFDASGDLTDDETAERLKIWLLAFIEWVEKKP